MADPKDAKKESPPDKDLIQELIVILVVLSIFGMFINKVTELFTTTGGGSDALGAPYLEKIVFYFTYRVLPFFKSVAFMFTVLFSVGIAWTISILTKLNHTVYDFYHPEKKIEPAPDAPKQNIKWERIISHLNSQNPNDWKFAILEADIMLNDMLDTLNYPGSTMADKLKVVNPGDFKSIEQAWEAHKIRNIVAHEGANYVLSDREAKRVIDLYKTVFEEFKLI